MEPRNWGCAYSGGTESSHFDQKEAEGAPVADQNLGAIAGGAIGVGAGARHRALHFTTNHTTGPSGRHRESTMTRKDGDHWQHHLIGDGEIEPFWWLGYVGCGTAPTSMQKRGRSYFRSMQEAPESQTGTIAVSSGSYIRESAWEVDPFPLHGMR